MTCRELAVAWRRHPDHVKRRLAGIEPARWLRGRGGRIADYDFQQLPADIQKDLSELNFQKPPQAAANLPLSAPAAASSDQGGGPNRTYSMTSAALVSPPLFSELALPQAVEDEASHLPTAEQQQEAFTLWSKIRWLTPQEWKPAKNGAARLTKQQAVSAIAEKEGVNPATVWRWLSAYNRRGLAGLCSWPRRDANISRALTKQECAELAALYTTGEGTAGNARACWREFCRQFRPITYDVVKAQVRNLPQVVRERALNGAKLFNDRQLPYISRNYERMAPNDVWVFDHARLDFWVNAWGKAARPWLTAIMDLRSRYIVGWCVSLQPDSLTIASALRMGLLAGGLPLAAYLDNGKDFRSRYLSGGGRKLPRWRNEDYERIEAWGGAAFPTDGENLLGELAVKIVYCMAYHPQSKPIERWFGTLHKQFDAGFNSYCGGKPSGRPETCQALLAEHRACVKAGSPESSPLPRIEEAAWALQAWVREEYHQQPHNGAGMRRAKPADLWQPSDRQVDEWRLDILMMKREERLVDRCAIRLFGHRYEHPENALFLHNGHTATVAYDRIGASSLTTPRSSSFAAASASSAGTWTNHPRTRSCGNACGSGASYRKPSRHTSTNCASARPLSRQACAAWRPPRRRSRLRWTPAASHARCQ